ncbi:unnamed protein product [Sphagnum tenellum]
MAELEGRELQNAHLDIHELFAYYNDLYFEGKLGACNVAWSNSRMTSLAAGVCKFSGGGGCEIRLSEPVLKSRTTAELKTTLLHEMIHAYLFSMSGNKNHDDHGPCFQHLMRSINQCSADDDQRPENGYNISICHNLEEDVDVNQVHHLKCETCGDFMKRPRIQAPSVSDCPRHEAKCGEAYQKEDQVNDDDLLTSGNLPMIGKKRPSIGASGSTAKRVTAVNSSLESSFAASKKVSDTRHETGSQDAEKKLLNAGSKTPPAPRLRNQEPEIAVREAIPQLQTNGAGARKRRRPPEGAQTAGKQEREPTVILAWKQWCMFEDDDKDGDMVGALVNKRDKRRIQERHRKVMLQEHKTGNAGSCTSQRNKSEVGVITGSLPGSTPAHEEQTGEYATRSTTLGGDNDKVLDGSSDFGIELANRESNVNIRHSLNDDDERQVDSYSRDGNTRHVFTLEQQQPMDPMNFSAPEESMVVNPLPGVITATAEEGAKTSDESLVQQQSLCTLTKILTEERLCGTDKRKGHGKGDKRCTERHVEDLELNLNNEEESESKKPSLLSTQATSIVDNEKDSMKGSNITDNPNDLLAKLPSTSRSQEEWYQGCEWTVPGGAGNNGLYEEQGESTGGLSDVANQRGKQKVIELSDEEEDSNRVSIERQAMSAQNSIHSLDDHNADGRATTSGIEISSVCLERGLGSRGNKKQHFAAAEELDPFFEDYNNNTGGGLLVEIMSPCRGQPGSPSSVEALKGKHHCRTYRRRKMQQGKAIAGDDSGEEVHGPVAKTNDAGSIEDIDSLGHRQLTEGVSTGVGTRCPICDQTLPTGISNAELNSHIDQCLAHYK